MITPQELQAKHIEAKRRHLSSRKSKAITNALEDILDTAESYIIDYPERNTILIEDFYCRETGVTVSDMDIKNNLERLGFNVRIEYGDDVYSCWLNFSLK